MKFTKKVRHELDLELTEEQKEAFELVSNCVNDVLNILSYEGNTEGLWDTTNKTMISTYDLRDVLDTLEELRTGSTFCFMEDDSDD